MCIDKKHIPELSYSADTQLFHQQMHGSKNAWSCASGPTKLWTVLVGQDEWWSTSGITMFGRIGDVPHGVEKVRIR